MKDRDGKKLSFESTAEVYMIALCILFSVALVGLCLTFIAYGLIAAGLFNSIGIIMGVAVFIWLLRTLADLIARKNWYDV